MFSRTAARLTVAAATLGLAGVTAGAGALSANAEVYLYRLPGYAGGSYSFANCDDDANFSNNYWPSGGSINDSVSSLRNGSRALQLSQHSWYRGAEIEVNPGQSMRDLRTIYFNNRASSLDWWNC